MSLPRVRPDSRSARTRDALIQAGLELFAKRPIDAVPIDDIVAAAGVAKGSFFNHFEDKQKFAGAIATEIRRDIEARVANANSALLDPLARLTGGMVVVVDFALSQRERAIVMLRGAAWSTAKDHPLNAGLRDDIDACIKAGLFNNEAQNSGLLFWLAVGQMLMADVVDRRLARTEAAECMREFIVMALLGLGVDAAQVHPLARSCAARLNAMLAN